MITRAEAVALTELLRTIRPAWDALTTINILCALAGHELADIAAAAIRTAQDKTMRTPQAIAFTDSAHWRPTVRNTTPTEERIEREARIRTRQQAIAHCSHCDARGYIAARGPDGTEFSRYPCQHDDPAERAARVKAWADHARAQIRPAPNQQETA